MHKFTAVYEYVNRYFPYLRDIRGKKKNYHNTNACVSQVNN